MTGTRPSPPAAGPEVEMLNGFLDFHRATLLMKVDGLADSLREQLDGRTGA